MATKSRDLVMTPIDLKKVVLVVGGTGTGKSTLINMLYNNEISKESLQKPCPVNFTRDSVTKKPQWIFNCKEGLVTGDTVGFGDPSMSNDEITKELNRFVAILRNGVHGIILVTRFGRAPTAEEQATVKAMMRVFGPSSRCYEHMMLVITHYDGEDFDNFEVKQRVINTWVGNDSEIKTLIKNLEDRVILTNNVTNNLYEVPTRPLRKQCLETLRLFIEFRCDELLECRLTPLSMWQDVVKPLLGFRVKSGEFISQDESSKIKSGYCSICINKEIDLPNLAFTECQHCFHKDCIQEKIKKPPAFCPECNTYLSVVYTPEICERKTVNGEIIYVRKTESKEKCVIL